MWRKTTEAKPSSPNTMTAEPIAAAPVQTQVEPPPVAETPVPTPASIPAAPVYSATTTKTVVAHDTSAASSIGSGLKIRGELSGSSDLFINGEAHGKITLAGSRVTVGLNGRVQADIEAREIIVEGAVQGNLKAHESVRLGASCKVQGAIVTPRISIEDGAGLRGKVEMMRPSENAKPSKSSQVAAQPAAVAAFKTVSATSERE
jgi:cytoskeletal protein CcmA (bactofilin family)